MRTSATTTATTAMTAKTGTGTGRRRQRRAVGTRRTREGAGRARGTTARAMGTRRGGEEPVVMGMTRVVRSVVVGETEGRGREVRARAVLGAGSEEEEEGGRRDGVGGDGEIIARVRRHGVWDADGDAEISV